MIEVESYCSRENCIHYIGIKSGKEAGEETDLLTCQAFPDKIPNEILSGDNKHTKPFPGDNGIQYERIGEK